MNRSRSPVARGGDRDAGGRDMSPTKAGGRGGNNDAGGWDRSPPHGRRENWSKR
jgi:hypothetical protein